jgi:hypothetical protein
MIFDPSRAKARARRKLAASPVLLYDHAGRPIASDSELWKSINVEARECMIRVIEELVDEFARAELPRTEFELARALAKLPSVDDKPKYIFTPHNGMLTIPVSVRVGKLQIQGVIPLRTIAAILGIGAGLSRLVKLGRKTNVGRSYILFVNYLAPSTDCNWRIRGLAWTTAFKDRFRRDMRYLSEILKPLRGSNGQYWNGRAFVFVDVGWAHLLAHQEGPRSRSSEVSDFALALGSIRMLSGLPGETKEVQIIGAYELMELLNEVALSLDKETRQKYGCLLDCRNDRMLRHAPGTAEAAIRIAHIGRQVPIFRFGDDVIFLGARRPDATEEKWMHDVKMTRGSIAKLCDCYVSVSENPRIHHFAFSGNYDQPQYIEEEGKQGAKPKENQVNEMGVLNGFATSVVELAELPRIMPSSANEKAAVRSSTALRFLRGLANYGANPFRQLISDAGLCVSDAAILDLPPYLNMRQNVLWIDDHLRFSLHDELGHFDTPIGEVGDARVGEVRFPKVRDTDAPTYGEVMFHMKVYMPRLILGCVADGWLRASPALKRAVTSEHSMTRIRAPLRAKVPYVYATELLDFMRGQCAGREVAEPKKQLLKQRLWELARIRLEKMAEEWSGSQLCGTFLGMFAAGRVPDGCPKDLCTYLPEHYRIGLSEAVKALPEEMPSGALTPTDFCEPSLSVALQVLVADFVEYVDVVQFWKFFVYSVRFLVNQDCQSAEMPTPRASLNWMRPPDELEREG